MKTIESGKEVLELQEILRIANKFAFIGDRSDSSVRSIFRGCMSFATWIAFPQMSDV
jgi:hypothetical protein